MSTSFDGVLEFLGAALNEIERIARAAIADQCANDEWTVDSDEDSDGQFRRATVFTTGSYSTVADMADSDGNESTAAHIALHDPRAVLARVAAERRVLTRHVLEPDVLFNGPPDACHTCRNFLWPCPTVRDLAHGHRHIVPGYNPAWAPDQPEDESLGV